MRLLRSMKNETWGSAQGAGLSSAPSARKSSIPSNAARKQRCIWQKTKKTSSMLRTISRNGSIYSTSRTVRRRALRAVSRSKRLPVATRWSASSAGPSFAGTVWHSCSVINPISTLSQIRSVGTTLGRVKTRSSSRR